MDGASGHQSSGCLCLSFPMRLRRLRQTPVLTRAEGSFSCQGVSKEGGCGGVNRVDLSFCVFPCFAVFGGLKIPRCWKKKTARKVSLSRPFLCVPQMLKLGLASSVPICASKQSTGKMINRPHFARVQGGVRHSPAGNQKNAAKTCRLSVLKRCFPKTLAFAFGLRLRSKTRCSKTRVLGRRLPNKKPQERLRFRALRGKTLAFKKRIAIVFLRFKDFPRCQGLRLGRLRSKNAAFCVCGISKPAKLAAFLGCLC